MATSAPLVIVGKTLYPRVLAMPGLPPAAAKIAAGRRGRFRGRRTDELPVKEFALRAKLIRALLESDGVRHRRRPASHRRAGPGPRRADLGLPGPHGQQLVVRPRLAAGVIPGTTNWGCRRRVVKAAAPLVEAHPYRQFLATLPWTPPQWLAWQKLSDSAAGRPGVPGSLHVDWIPVAAHARRAGHAREGSGAAGLHAARLLPAD